MRDLGYDKRHIKRMEATAVKPRYNVPWVDWKTFWSVLVPATLDQFACAEYKNMPKWPVATHSQSWQLPLTKLPPCDQNSTCLLMTLSCVEGPKSIGGQTMTCLDLTLISTRLRTHHGKSMGGTFSRPASVFLTGADFFHKATDRSTMKGKTESLSTSRYLTTYSHTAVLSS